MRIFALLLVLLLAAPMAARPALAQAPGLSTPTMADLSGVKGGVRDALNKSRLFLSDWMAEAQKLTGVTTNEQLFDVGVGVMAGLVLADVLGTGGLGTTFYAGAGGLLGNWVASK